MFEKIKVFFIGLITGIVSFFTLSFFRKRKDVSNNGIGIDTTREQQSRIDTGFKNAESTIDAVELTVEEFGITNDKLERITESNNTILQSIKKRKSNN